MVSNQDESRIETSDEFAQDEVDKILSAVEKESIVQTNVENVEIVLGSNSGCEWIISPF